MMMTLKKKKEEETCSHTISTSISTVLLSFIILLQSVAYRRYFIEWSLTIRNQRTFGKYSSQKLVLGQPARSYGNLQVLLCIQESWEPQVGDASRNKAFVGLLETKHLLSSSDSLRQCMDYLILPHAHSLSWFPLNLTAQCPCCSSMGHTRRPSVFLAVVSI